MARLTSPRAAAGLLTAGASLFCGAVVPASAGTVYSSFNATLGVTVSDGAGKPRAAGGSFDIHAGARVTGAGVQVRHIPTPPVALRNFFPTRQSAMAAREVNKDKTLRRIGGFARTNNPPVPYTQAAKDFTRGIPFDTTPALRSAVDPGNGRRTIAEANAKIQFETAADGSLSVNSRGSYSSLEREGTFPNNGPAGEAGTLVHDPLILSDSEPGDLVRLTFALSKDDFRVQVTDPDGTAGASFEVGTDALTSAGPLGLSDGGLPLLFRFDMAFAAGGPAVLQFLANDDPALSLSFFDPEDSDAPIAGDMPDFLIDRLLAVLAFDPAQSQWTLTRDVTLFGARFLVPDGLAGLTLDYTARQAVSAAAVPEPSTWILASLGSLGLVAVRWRKARSASRTSATVAIRP